MGVLDWNTGLGYWTACTVCDTWLYNGTMTDTCVCLLFQLAWLCRIEEVLGSNKRVALAKEAREKMAKVNLAVYLTLPGLNFFVYVGYI